MKPLAPAVGVAGIATSLALVAPAFASGTTARPPAPCQTFSVTAADRLFGVDSTTVPTEKARTTDRGTNTETRTCKVRTGDEALDVSTSFALTSITGPFTTYKRPKLGHGGRILVSTTSTFPETVATYERDDVFFTDVLNRILKHHGRKLYRFALKQSNAFAKRRSQ